MKKRLLACILLVLYVIALAGCACEHSWKKADCDDPRTCRECGETEGEPEHDWEKASCNAPKTCEDCGETEGEALDHEWLPASCSAPETCERCGETRGEALEHVWDGRYCANCGEERVAEEITLTVWTPASDQADGNSWLWVMLKKFEEAHPEYAITWNVQVCSEGDAATMVTSDVQSAADVYMYANDQLGTLMQAGALAKLGGDYLAQVKRDNSATFVDTVTYTDGNVYGFPYTSNTWFMYYNKSIFTEEDVKSLETMLAKGKVAFPLSNSWYLASFYVANGGTLFGPNGNDAAAGIQFGGANGTAVTKYLVDLAANRNLVNDTDGKGMAGLANGTIGAYFSGSWDAAYVRDALGENMGVAQLPTITINGETKQLRSFAGSKAIGVNPYSNNMTAAFQLAAFLASEEAQLLHYEMRGIIPAASTLATNPTVATDLVAIGQMLTMQNTATVQPCIPEMGNYWGPAGNMGAAIVNGQVTHKNAEAKTKEFNDAMNGF